MKLECTWIGLHANEHRVYWVLHKRYDARETKCAYFVKDELGYERRVSKKTMAETGKSRDCYATCFAVDETEQTPEKSIMKMQFTLGELIELEYALADWEPSDDESKLDAHRAFFKVSKALERPWTKRFANADEAAKYHLEALKEGASNA